ncbi:MAG: hypothetical protein OES90_09310, partial [Xanthomonadales bacterium]|nr:hypothetical protein [Xanthomonadales bacterium]
HDSSRIYVGSQRVWRSDNRGDSWQAVSGDLTTNTNRYELGYRGRVWSVDDMHDNGAMSKYSTITSISESPVTEGVLYTGSDDGLIYATSDGGANWQRAESLPGLPERVFINDLEASLYDADTVFAIADAHKTGDFSPYVFVSANQGRKWRSISGDLPDGTIVWAIQQDHENENLLFLGTEYGVYFSVNGGVNWHKMAGAPTVAFRDLKLQRRDNDIVGATFGRGIYILDDYSALRTMANESFGNAATLFPVRDAWWYIPSAPSQATGMPTLGSDSFRTANPEFGASFTYYLDKSFESSKLARQAEEKSQRKAGKDIAFPGWDRLAAESLDTEPRVMILVSDSQDEPVRWIEASAKKGTHRVSWDLRLPAPDAIDLTTPEFVPPWADASPGPLVAPGVYSARLFALSDGEVLPLGEAQSFNVKPVRAAPDGIDYTEVADYKMKSSALLREVAHAREELSRTQDLLAHMKVAAVSAPQAAPSLFARLDAFGVELSKLGTRLSGDSVRGRLNETSVPSIGGRAYNAANTQGTTRAATATQKADFEIAKRDFTSFTADLDALLTDQLVQLEADLLAAGAPSWR